MNNYFNRTQLLLGDEGFEKIANSTVAVFGIGGVGSLAAESLVRSGLGKIILVDYDIIDTSNVNRQIHVTSKVIGRPKVTVMKERLLEINPDLIVETFNEKYNESTVSRHLSKDYDYIIDSIDMVSSKISLIINAKNMGIPIISAMGAGNKLDPTRFKVGDIYSTKICPLAKVMRKELKRRGVKDLKVVWSDELPLKINLESADLRKAIPGSIMFATATVGLIMSAEVIKDISL